MDNRTKEALHILNTKFPRVECKDCSFANGEYYVQRDLSFYERYKATVINYVFELGEVLRYPSLTYGWFRCLDDGGSLLYPYACRIQKICPVCYKEWGQEFYSNKCCRGR